MTSQKTAAKETRSLPAFNARAFFSFRVRHAIFRGEGDCVTNPSVCEAREPGKLKKDFKIVNLK